MEGGGGVEWDWGNELLCDRSEQFLFFLGGGKWPVLGGGTPPPHLKEPPGTLDHVHICIMIYCLLPNVIFSSYDAYYK